MIIIYIDIVLLIILLCLTVFTCGYCIYRVYRMQQNGEIAILLKPTKVVFSHRKEGDPNGELRTVVAYQNPFTGEYCIHKSRLGRAGYVNALNPLNPLSPLPALNALNPLNRLASPDSGLSDEYEPLRLEPLAIEEGPHVPAAPLKGTDTPQIHKVQSGTLATPELNSVNKSWHWNYTEYQI